MSNTADLLSADPGSLRFAPHGTQRSRFSEIDRLQAEYNFTGWASLALGLTLVASYFVAPSAEDWLCAAVIEVAAFSSVYVWSTRRVVGLPLLPIFALASWVYYGLPFATGHPITYEYDFSEKLYAALTVAGALMIMTATWWPLGKAGRAPRDAIMQMDPEASVRALFAALMASVLFQTGVLFYFFTPSSELFGVLRAVLYTLGVLSTFPLAYLAGRRLLRTSALATFIGLLGVLFAYSATSLYLNGVAQMGVIAALGYALGSNRIPWKSMAALFLALAILQAGKADMREQYWNGADSNPNPILLLSDWTQTGVANIAAPAARNDRGVSLAQRVSLMQMLLKTQTEAPDLVTYLNGESYTSIPTLLVPRFIAPNRVTTAQKLIELNEHYGLLTEESAQSTSIGWGMLAEGYANFGLLGCIGIAALLGIALGVTQHSCGRYSVLSARGMLGLLVLLSLLNMDVLSQTVTSFVQSVSTLLVLVFFTMRHRSVG